MPERCRTLLSLIEAFLERQLPIESFIEAYHREWWADTDAAKEVPEFAEEWARIAKAKKGFRRGQYTPGEFQSTIRWHYLEIARKQEAPFDFVSRNFVDDIYELLDDYQQAVNESDRTATPNYLFTLIGEAYARYLDRVGTDANKIEKRRCAALCYLYRKRRGANLTPENPSDSRVPITVRGVNGNSLSLEAVVDPDFDGDIALPLDRIEELGLTEYDRWYQRFYSTSPSSEEGNTTFILHMLYFAEVRCADYVTLACIVPTEGKASISSGFPNGMDVNWWGWRI